MKPVEMAPRRPKVMASTAQNRDPTSFLKLFRQASQDWDPVFCSGEYRVYPSKLVVCHGQIAPRAFADQVGMPVSAPHVQGEGGPLVRGLRRRRAPPQAVGWSTTTRLVSMLCCGSASVREVSIAVPG